MNLLWCKVDIERFGFSNHHQDLNIRIVHIAKHILNIQHRLYIIIRTFFHCFGMSCFVCVVWFYLGIFLVFCLLQVPSDLFLWVLYCYYLLKPYYCLQKNKTNWFWHEITQHGLKCHKTNQPSWSDENSIFDGIWISDIKSLSRKNAAILIFMENNMNWTMTP